MDQYDHMKIISLNTWGGRAGKDKLLNFFEQNKDIDVFCLQEIWSAPYENLEGYKAGDKEIRHEEIMTRGMQDISTVLSDHSSYFRPHFLNNYGLMMLVNKNVKVIKEGEVFVYKEKGHIPEGDIGNHARNIQYITFFLKGKMVTVINFHGLWNGKGKTDTEDRIMQSKNIIEFIKKADGRCLLCGDFNLLPDTESLKLFETYGMRNLVKENNVLSTRTSFYTKPEKYADYVFVSGDLEIKKFEVLPDEVSDHAPLMVEFQ